MLTGAVSAYASTVRYTDGLLLLPIVVMVIWRFFKAETPAEQQPAARKKIVGEFVLMTVAAICAVTPSSIHHWRAFGAPWATGYSLCGESTGFGWKFFKDNWWLMLTRMDTGGLILLFPLGLVGLAYLATHDAKRGLFLAVGLSPACCSTAPTTGLRKARGPGMCAFLSACSPH